MLKGNMGKRFKLLSQYAEIGANLINCIGIVLTSGPMSTFKGNSIANKILRVQKHSQGCIGIQPRIRRAGR